jgi:hypothetical protein
MVENKDLHAERITVDLQVVITLDHANSKKDATMKLPLGVQRLEGRFLGSPQSAPSQTRLMDQTALLISPDQKTVVGPIESRRLDVDPDEP